MPLLRAATVHCTRRQSQRREALAALPMGYVTICPDYSFGSPRWLMGQYVLFPGGWVFILARSIYPLSGARRVHYKMARRLLSCTHFVTALPSQ